MFCTSKFSFSEILRTNIYFCRWSQFITGAKSLSQREPTIYGLKWRARTKKQYKIVDFFNENYLSLLLLLQIDNSTETAMQYRV